MGALRVLGRSAIFDDLYEGSFVSGETHRRFFHRFVAVASLRLYPRYVRLPQTTADVRRAESLYVSVTCMMLCVLSACVMCAHCFMFDTLPVCCLLTHLCRYVQAGFPGCFASLDVTHITWDSTPAFMQNLCIGKEGYTTLAYELA